MSHYEELVEQLRLNSAQWAAFESSGHCVTLAGPGSGKSKLLTAKLARVLRTEVRAPRGVACLTYSNQCARELDRKIQMLGRASATFVGTLHGFCLRYVLSPFGGMLGLNLPYPLAVASPATQSAALTQAVKKVGVNNDRAFQTEFRRFRCAAIDRRDGEDGWQVGDGALTDVCVEYERILKEQGQLDFDGIISVSVAMIECNEIVRKCIRARFPVLFIDEYQDLGLPLHRMVLSLCFDAGIRLFAVGDPDQSIYGFAGARPELLQELAGRTDVQRVDLLRNYRSTRAIVAASENALGEYRGYEAASADEGIIQVKCLPAGLTGQVDYVLDTLVPAFLQAGDKYGDIALLYPTKYEGEVLEAGLAERKISYVRLDAEVGYRRTPFIVLIENLAAWCCRGANANLPPLSTLLNQWSLFLRDASSADARRSPQHLVRFLLSYRDGELLCREWLEALDTEVVRRTPYPLKDDDREAFKELCVAASTGKLKDSRIRVFVGKSGSPDHISLMNLHTAKGSEFNSVVLLGVEDGRLPIYSAKSDEELAEQRRLFFVGISRARRELHVLYSGFTENRFGKRFESVSPFVVELQAHLDLCGNDEESERQIRIDAWRRRAEVFTDLSDEQLNELYAQADYHPKHNPDPILLTCQACDSESVVHLKDDVGVCTELACRELHMITSCDRCGGLSVEMRLPYCSSCQAQFRYFMSKD